MSRTPSLVAAAVVGLAVDLLVVEGLLAARRSYLPAESAPEIEGDYGDPADRTIRMIMIGDSTAAGVGASSTDTSMGGALASRLAADGLHVQLSGVGVSGSRAGDLGPQVSRALLAGPDVAVLLVGANDATHFATGPGMTGPLVEAVSRLRGAGVPVVLGTCPDLSGPRAFLRPLRDLHGAVGRLVAARQSAAATEAGAVCVDLARLTGGAFKADITTLSSDLFHPSDRGYALWADALLPALRAAVGSALEPAGS